jgi:hypothetical protein
MIMLAICSTLIGSALAIRFRFVVLLPIIFLGSVVLVAISAIQGEPFFQMALTVIVFATSLQLGYVFAALMKCAMIPVLGETPLRLQRNPEVSVVLPGLTQTLDPNPGSKSSAWR